MNIKLAMVGQSGCGKSSILYRIQSNTFVEAIPKQSLELMQKKMQFNDSFVNLQLIDTVGQEQFNSISPQFYRNLNAIGITCNSVQSLEKANYWYAQSKQYNQAAKIYLILSKSDQKTFKKNFCSILQLKNTPQTKKKKNTTPPKNPPQTPNHKNQHTTTNHKKQNQTKKQHQQKQQKNQKKTKKNKPKKPTTHDSILQETKMHSLFEY
ncbi:Rab1a [Hexamita inflata]|uniref:Rab1a n=1 Tax=Hexamita inflata TaxID=28002 RepID=A0ABP1HC19_9EUKA